MSSIYMPCASALSGMSSFQHIDIGPSLKLAKELLAKPSDAPDASALSNFKFSYTDWNLAAAFELGVALGNHGSTAGKRVAVYEYQRFVDIPRADGAVVRWGSSVRCRVNFKKLNGQAQLGGIWGIAASVALGYAEAVVEVDGIGIKPGTLFDAIPKVTTLDEKSTAEVIHAFTETIPALMKDERQLVPTLLGVWGENRNDEEERRLTMRRAVARSYALSVMAAGKALSNAGEWSHVDNEFKDVMSSVYEDVAGIGDANIQPNELAKYRAREMLGLFETEHRD